MKRVFLLLAVLAASAFGFNYSGTWVNKSSYKYNDPIKLKISGTAITPYLYRDEHIVKLKRKNATKTGTGLFEAWGFGAKNLVLYIKPINSTKIKVYEKKIDTNRKIVVTRSFIFRKKGAVNSNIKNRYVGNWKSTGAFSAISKLTIRKVDNQLYVRAWKNTGGGQRPLGLARAKYYSNALQITWYKGNLVVKAKITGMNYNPSTKKYQTLKLDLRAKNLNSGIENRQTIYFSRNREIYAPVKPIRKRIKLGPLDINLLINSY